MLISIIICNYNYGRFLRDAIDSALGQSYPSIELVVVDDGSTDESRAIISSYGERLIAVFKENGGQASAANVGFAASHGDGICFLDADDLFLPEKVARVVRAWQENRQAGLVYHQLQTVDVENRVRLGKPCPREVWRGDMRGRLERSGGWWPCPTTTGLCFLRPSLERVFPLPVRDEGMGLVSADAAPVFLDGYLAHVVPFLNPIVGLREPLALYRTHEQSSWSAAHPQLQEASRRQRANQLRLNQYISEFNLLREALRTLNIPSSISLDDHFRYHQFRRATGEPLSLFKVLGAVLRCPTLPPTMKWRETVRIALAH